MNISIEEQGFPRIGRACLATLLICLIAMSAYVDRGIISILVEPMKGTLAITDTQIGLLQGTAFILFYAVMGIPLGKLVDRTVRRNLLSAGTIIWSAMTIACGFASSFGWLFLARVGVGVGEAILAPAAFSLVADLFPPPSRGRAISAVTLSGALGGGVSYMLGGIILDVLPTAVNLPVIGTRWDWQVAFLIAGCPGLLIGMLALLIPEPARQERDLAQEVARKESFLSFALARKRAFVPVYAANTLLAMVAYTNGAWMAAYFIRRFAIPSSQVGITLGLITIVAAVCGGFGGGIASDLLARRRLSGRVEVLLLAASVGACCVVAYPLCVNPTWGFTLLAFTLFAIGTGTSTASVMIQEILPNHLRGEGLGYYFLCQGIIGQGLGPISVSLFKDYVLADETALNLSIMSICAPALALVGLLSLVARDKYAVARQEVLSNAHVVVSVT